MIRYTLRCDNDHEFDSWFQSSDAFDTLVSTGRVACVQCGSAKVAKAPMAPSVAHGDSTDGRPLARPASEVEAALAAMRRQVEAHSEYVGMEFATEARRIHEGDAPERSIYGEARMDEARRLIEDGVPVAPLPFMPNRKTH